MGAKGTAAGSPGGSEQGGGPKPLLHESHSPKAKGWNRKDAPHLFTRTAPICCLPLSPGPAGFPATASRSSLPAGGQAYRNPRPELCMWVPVGPRGCARAGVPGGLPCPSPAWPRIPSLIHPAQGPKVRRVFLSWSWGLDARPADWPWRSRGASSSQTSKPAAVTWIPGREAAPGSPGPGPPPSPARLGQRTHLSGD